MRTQILAAAILLATVTGFAQQEKSTNSEEVKFYRLDFAVKELDSGKVVNTRNYEITVSTERGMLPHQQSIRSGDKVPIQAPSGNFSYLEVGVNIDCQNIKEVGNQLALRVSSDISTLGDSGHASSPLIRQTKWMTDAIVTLRKSTLIAFSDYPASKQQIQLELTATPITPTSR